MDIEAIKAQTLKIIAIFAASLALCFAAVYGARFTTQYDLGQLAYILVIFFPIIAALIGIMCSIYIRRLWSAPIIALLVFLITMLVSFRNVNYVFLLVYIIISFASNVLVYSIKGIAKRRKK